jgi:mRNA-degrading endonuclease HigB of HigAB toxin-antitoxin module
MELVGIAKLVKLKNKNRGNVMLCNAIDKLIDDIENKKVTNQEELIKMRPDADLVHNEGFYIFNINIHRTMILIEFEIGEEGEANIVWCGSHDEYETLFKNNKNTIKKWLRSKGFIN